MTTAIAALPFFGETCSSFDRTSAAVFETTAAVSGIFCAFNGAWAANALLVPGSPTSVTYASTPTWSAASTFWTHFDVSMAPPYNAIATEGYVVRWYDGATEVARMTMNDGSAYEYGNCRFYTLQGGVMTFTFEVDVPFGPYVYRTFDIGLVGASASGSIAVYVDGIRQGNATGLDHSGWSGVTNFSLYGGAAAGLIAMTLFFSQVIGDSSSTVGRNLYHIRLNTNSATNTGWTGTVTDINEIPTNDSNFIASTSAAQISTFLQSPAPVFTGLNILAVGVGTRALTTGSGPPNLKLALRDSGANYVSTAIGAGAGFQAMFNSWIDNPATSAPWTVAVVQALEYGAESSS